MHDDGILESSGVVKILWPYILFLSVPAFLLTETHLERKTNKSEYSTKCEGALIRETNLFEGLESKKH